MQGPLVSAIKHIRGRLQLSQAALAGHLGCTQNAVSKYEAGKAQPGLEILSNLWRMADQAERGFIQKYLYEQSFGAGSDSHANFVEAVMAMPQRPFPLEIAAVLNRPDAPLFLREIVSLYLRVGASPDAVRVFEQATNWLHVQFQMLDYAKKTEYDPSRVSADDYVGTLLKEAADEPLIREQEPRKT